MPTPWRCHSPGAIASPLAQSSSDDGGGAPSPGASATAGALRAPVSAADATSDRGLTLHVEVPGGLLPCLLCGGPCARMAWHFPNLNFDGWLIVEDDPFGWCASDTPTQPETSPEVPPRHPH